MSYLVLARKYRPRTFADVVGQEAVTRTLSNAIKRDKVAHAYLFCGPRGVGKTSIARIFAKSLNCMEGPTPEPCGKCATCTEIAEGTSLAVREIDGASHNSVDNVRELIDSFRALPPPGSRFKIYIIDEVHMLSTSAFNALLKSLEEPPPNTVFILATTEPHKIPETVISRCQRHDLRALGSDEVCGCLRGIAEAEKVKVDEGVFRLIARLSEGSMRDAQSLFDRVQSYCEDTITTDEASEVLGVVDKRTLFQLSECVFSHDAAQALSIVQQAFSGGLNPSLFLREFVAHFRELLVAKFGGAKALSRLGLGEEDKVALLRQAEPIGSQDLQDLVQLAREGADEALRSAYPKYALEGLLVRLATRESVKDLAVILGKVKERLTGKQAGGGTYSAPSGVARKQAASPSTEPSETPRVSSPPKERKKSSSAETPSAKQPARKEATASAPKGGYDWAGFVGHVAKSGQRMLCEQLKRLVVEKFEGGSLAVRGPEFTISYFARTDNKQKLAELLEGFSGQSGWNISLEAGVGAAPAAESLHEAEKSKAVEARREREDSLRKLPQVENLKSVFPGSEVEAVRFK